MTLVGQKAYSVEEIRKTYTKAYAPWIEEEENFISEYAKKFGRKPGGIRSRIAKLLNGEIVYSKKQMRFFLTFSDKHIMVKE